MDEKKPGKRLAADSGMSAGKKRALIITGTLAAVLAAGYLALCAYVGVSGRILPRVTAAGVELGGLTQAQAAERMRTGAAGRYGAATVTLTYGNEGQSAVLGGDVVEADAAAAARDAWAQGREHGFFAQGGLFLASLATGFEVDSPLEFTEAGRAQVDQVLDTIAQAVGGDLRETTWQVAGEELVFHMGTPGTGLDQDALRQTILERFAALDSAPYGVVPTATDPSFPDLEAIHREIYAEVREAELDPETFEVTESVTGMTFDIAQARQLLEGAAWNEEVSVPLEVTRPRHSTEELKALLFRDVLGETTSQVSGSANRKSNVALAASTYDERILLPGEVFSYNDSTGSRTADKGYLMAPVYKGGKSVDEVGGGICQPSSTLYNAVLLANLKIVERHNHSFAVGYVDDGNDATVYYGSLDFRFENDTEYPIKLKADSFKENGRTYLKVTIYGTKTDDLHVELGHKKYDVIGATTVYQVDPALSAGATRVEDTPYTGRTVETYRNLYDADGNLVSSTLESISKYKKRDKLVMVSPADAYRYGLNADGTALDPNSQPPAAESPAVTEPAVTPPGVNDPVISLPPAEPPAATDPGAGTAPGETPAVSDPGVLPVQPGETPAVSDPVPPPAVTQPEPPGESPAPPESQVPDIGIPVDPAAMGGHEGQEP